jgi:AcrR family transcriptional regulator
MPRKPATEAQRLEVRQSLRRAAQHVHDAKGISGVTARAIALEAGVSVGTIYSHFGDLKSLMQSLWEEPLQAINARFHAAASEHSDPIDRLRALMQTYFNVASADEELYRNAFMFVRPAHLPTPDKDADNLPAFPGLIRTALLDGQNAGAIRPGSVTSMTELIWAGLHGTIAMPINFDRISFQNPSPLRGDMIDLLLAQFTR